MDLHEYSETLFGLCWLGRRNPEQFNANDFEYPYNTGIEIFQKGGAKEDVVKVLSPAYIQAAEQIASKYNGLGNDTFLDTGLAQAAHYYRLGEMLERTGDKLKKNKPVDILPIYGEMTSLVSKQTTGLTSLENIDISNYHPFQKCGYAPIDNIVGNFPSDGPVVIFGATASGKSHMGANLLDCFLHEYPNKTGAIYTLEMSAEHWAWRETNMYPSMKEIINNRLYISGAVRSIEELIGEIQLKRLDCLVIDDMDNLVKAQSAEEYERVYRKIKEICRFMKIPVIVLAQPNREAKKSNRFLTQYDISWSGAAENSAALLIGLQRASMRLDDDTFPTFEDEKHYIMFWKSRDGWPLQQGSGAVILEPDKHGKYQQLWRGNVLQNRLWSVGSGAKKIGNSKKYKKDDL